MDIVEEDVVKCEFSPKTPEPPMSMADDEVDEVDSAAPAAGIDVAPPPTPPEIRGIKPEVDVEIPELDDDNDLLKLESSDDDEPEREIAVNVDDDDDIENIEEEEKPGEDNGADDDDVPLETESLDPDPIVEQSNCKMCQKKFSAPRVLACLHVFCEPCIMDILMVDELANGKFCTVTCPLCKQMTKLGNQGIAALQPDYVSTNVIDISALDPMQLACTSCKSRETAISRCNDCANFLCASCDDAHQYMRCFENHKVVPLEEMRLSEERVAIHKPLFCRLHPSENLKYFCFNCQVPVCNDCLLCEHKGAEHNYEIISDAEKRMRNEVEGLMREARTKLSFCEKTTNNLDSSLHELQSQHDAAQDVINETYQAFKMALDRCHEDSLKELEKLHSERELKIMDLFHNVEKSAERIENACGFTGKVLEQANAPEFLSLKKMISSQFLNLIHTIPKAEINFTLKFVSNREKFEQHLPECFGKLCTEASPPSPKETTPPPTLPGMPPQLNKNTPNNGGTLTGSVTASSPISLPTSMQSSFDGDISTLGNHASFMQHVLTPEPPSPQINQPPPNFHQQPPPLQGLTSIAEYNLHRLANLAGTSPADQCVQPAPPANPQSQFTIADLISGDPNAFNNLQALAKIGLPDLPRPSSIIPDFPNAMVPPPSLLPFNDNGDAFASNNNNNQIIPGRAKATPMQIRCKFGSLGPSKGQFNAPHGFCLGLEEEIIVADTNNHRIQIFEKNGTFKFQFGVPGKDEGQLWYPRKVAVMRANSRFVVCDRGNERSRMQIFTKNGHFIKKIAIRYIDVVAGLAVTNSGHIVAVDSVSPTVFIISEEGELVHWFDCSDFMREPSDIAINGSDFYVCDFKGHCVAVFSESGQFIMRIGSEKVTCFPNGIDISDAGDILIGDSHGNRFHVACYSREGVLQSEFECPHVKVSRCCGLKITSEGYVVTLAKNNHHVLVLNTLYIQ